MLSTNKPNPANDAGNSTTANMLSAGLSTQKPSRQQGSPNDFEQDWSEALASQNEQYLIYPVEKPTRQAEFFENYKAGLITTILADSDIQKGFVLEYGCGAAGISIFLANRGYKTVASDLSRTALKVAGNNARSHLETAKISNFERLNCDTFQLPFPDSYFDIVMSFGLLEHFNEDALHSVLIEVGRVLRPGGLFLADIAHGRFSCRTLGIWISLTGSMIINLLCLRWKILRELPSQYLDHYYESKLDKLAYRREMQTAGIEDIQVRFSHPFPPLALSGCVDHVYVRFMQALRPFWDWFFQTQPKWGNYWGWLYIAWGAKASLPSSIEDSTDR